ncbi:coiled-coil domain-containing protein 42 homolog [Babylonia areolata]|uniref:coiled-coil domain-containing protein 42 homolog n=1 Tax=Babylonia areolata TaxID=304850 RepID=UPI003FD01A3A
MATKGDYKLDLNTDKRNVFVTQLHDREDEDDVSAFPVVKESGDKLIETGINTLQRTLLLKKEVEVEKVDVELEAKRHEFRSRMEACAQRQVEVQKKQQRMKDRVSKFEKFIQENEAKRRRAIQKYQQEVKLKDQKISEYDLLLEQLEELKARHEYLANKLVKYKKFEEYLMRVIEAMPEDYLPSSEDKVKGLMMRHRTLSESNMDLIENVEFMQDELEKIKGELETMKQEHAKQKVSDSSTLARLQGQQDSLSEVNKQIEVKFNNTKGTMRQRRTELGVIFMAINNIYDKCQTSGSLIDPDDWFHKLLKIRDYLNDREDVAHMATRAHSAHSGSNSGSAKGTRQPPPVKITVSKS